MVRVTKQELSRLILSIPKDVTFIMQELGTDAFDKNKKRLMITSETYIGSIDSQEV